MPEGPEVETIRLDLSEHLLGLSLEQVWLSGKKMRQTPVVSDFKPLFGVPVTSVNRKGKLLYFETAQHSGVFFHLGMSGRLHVNMPDDPTLSHTHFRGFFANGLELRLVDPRRFGGISVFLNSRQRDQELTRLGPDPLFLTSKDQAHLIKRIRSGHRNIKSILLDQSVMSGVGNIYASEALFGAGISPFLKGCELSVRQVTSLLKSTHDSLALAVKNRGTTFMSYQDAKGAKGQNLQHLKVFMKDQTPCPTCQEPIQKVLQNGRSTYFCAQCQRVNS